MKFEDVPSRDVNVRRATVEFYPQPTMESPTSTSVPISPLLRPTEGLLPLFSRALHQSGAAGQTTCRSRSIAAHTGGLGALRKFSHSPQTTTTAVVSSSGRPLDRNAQSFIELLRTLSARLEVEPRR